MELVVIVALALGLALGIQAFIVKPYQIPSGSMIPTLEVGQRVLVNRFIYHFTDPSVGDIMVFHPPKGADFDQCGAPHPGAPCAKPTQGESDQNFIKRLVGLPGDHLRVIGGHVYNDGKLVADSDIAEAGDRGGALCQPARYPPKRQNGKVAQSADGKPVPDKSKPPLQDSCTFPRDITVPPGHYFMMGDNRGNSDDSRVWGPIPRSSIIGKAFATYWPPDRLGIF